MALGAAPVDRFGSSVIAYGQALRVCAPKSPASEQERCYLETLLRADHLRPAADAQKPATNTLSMAIAEGRGSCAALVAVALALTEPLGDPFEAVIFRDHVLLASRAETGVYFEVLDGGRVVEEGELRRYEPHPPGGPLRVSGRDYLPYYLDNLAARLVESGDAAAADRTFRAAIVLNPKAPRIRYNYGTFLLDTGDASAALEQLDRAIHLGWKDADAFVNRGVAKWKLSRLRDARRDFRRALKLDPGNHRASTNLRRIDESTE